MHHFFNSQMEKLNNFNLQTIISQRTLRWRKQHNTCITLKPSFKKKNLEILIKVRYHQIIQENITGHYINDIERNTLARYRKYLYISWKKYIYL